MAIADLLRTGVALAKTTLHNGRMLPNVTHRHWDGTTRTAQGRAELGSPVTRRALVEDVDEQVVDANGNKVSVATKVTFLEAVDVTYEDSVVLPDGRTGRLVKINRGVLDRAGAPILVEVYF